MTPEEQEQQYVDACRTLLIAGGYCVWEHPPVTPEGRWVVRGTEFDEKTQQQEPAFVVGHPRGRAASWWQACKINGISPPTHKT